MGPKHLLLPGTAICSFLAAVNPVFSQVTAFTYQGRLNDGASPADGIYDSAGGGVQQGSTLIHSPTGVTNGLFTVTLDFGASVFTGADRWLEVGVRTSGGGGLAPSARTNSSSS